MVEGAALEMLCTEMYLGFESLTLRQIRTLILIQSGFFIFAPHPISRALIYEALRLVFYSLLIIAEKIFACGIGCAGNG